jgi:hypothetical protein
MAKSNQSRHSAQVKMKLLVNGSSIPVAQMGPDFLLVTQPVDHPPANASIVMQVDESERRWEVHLPTAFRRLPNGLLFQLLWKNLELNSRSTDSNSC